jgi:light-regulated signal transduction histidine kinase (bacteriophytochrome)
VIVVCFEVTDLVIAKNRAEKSEAHLETKVKERTSELEQKNSQLIKANQELEQFAYVASHDLQEPLRKIRTFSSILQKQLPADSHSKKYFDKIHSSSDRMAQLIKDVLNYSRLSNGKPSFKSVDLNEVLSEVLQDFELLIDETEAEVVSGTLPVVPGHQLQLHQLFANLIGNALKFSGNKPVIEVTGRTISQQELAVHHAGVNAENYVEVCFRDNGIGFEQKFSDQIFTIFQRLHDKETTGTGIGLALCKKIVELHRGFIRAESAPGQGAVFFVYLPLEAPATY